ncbi:MAG: hypothetical protein G5Z42_01160 [Caldisphaeraceae archaeon]|nr:hypothetical protein [Caldisphaeraceae archaeon]
MDSTEYLKIAYTLLPPPLSALPAKYWTSISLLLHSYTVARTFQALLKLAGAKDLPENEAFIIGFLHDLAQKLGKSPETLKVTYRWVLERLSSELKFTLPEARKIAKTLETNPAETVRKTEFPDPLLPIEIWKLLMLADELQNSSDALPWAIKVRDTVSSKFGKTPNILIYSVNLPQPFVRYTLWDVIEEKIEEKIGCNTYNLEECNVFAIASLQRLIVLSELNIGKIEIGWDEIIGREKNRNETDVLSVYDIENLKNNIEKCKSEKTKKDEEQEEKGISSRFKFKNKHCEPGIHRNKKRQKKIRFPEDLYDRVGTYELMLHYFGPEKNAELDDFYLPLYAKDQLYRVSITGVKFEEGGFICPICGVRHREGFVAGIIGDIIGENQKSGIGSYLLILIET